MGWVMQKNNEKLNGLISETVKNFASLSDADVIIGKPFVTPSGTTVIPVSKMTVGFLTGNGEYGEIKLFQPNKNYPSTAASGGVASVKPCGFLTEKDGEIKYVHCPSDVFERAYDTIEELLKNINEK